MHDIFLIVGLSLKTVSCYYYYYYYKPSLKFIYLSLPKVFENSGPENSMVNIERYQINTQQNTKG